MHDIFAPRTAFASLLVASSRRTPRSLHEAGDLSIQSRAVLAGERQICLEAAFDLYIELKAQGYRPGNHRLDVARGQSWRQHSSASTASAKRVWQRVLGNPLFFGIERADVARALQEIRNLPKYHGKHQGGGDAADENGRMDQDPSAQAPISAATFMRIGRTARQVGDLLIDLGLAVDNPFDLCSWSLTAEAHLRRQDQPGNRARDLHEVDVYLSLPIFRGIIGEAGDPLFWVPLLMRLGGLRLGEAVHLAPADLQYRDGIPVICIASIDRDAKTAGFRREAPVARRLQDLGLIDLFELRRKQREVVLFPELSEHRPRADMARFRRHFVRYCAAHGIKASALHFNDFRKALHRRLLEMGCPVDVARVALGHVARETQVPFLDDNLRAAVYDALAKAGEDLPDIVGPFQ
ncbi:tyrosine-type recombinase/integrase [Roseovarius sp. SCSIO 43702]|uniref:tyrosine-type recombinase/integrase n=1 Tax=Roseovarius sp. SCSIO 43702 TaxID=2823043 RepID=UPI001C736D4D|nr:tyrosine-type recombinase/integrase [Roseovarius sp. SCSIO 43702]QYX55517.1 tyrosine-type recombinase/integrase [Roseovarius sp. SCSIO 43702]